VATFETEIAKLDGIDLEGLRRKHDAARNLVNLESKRATAQGKLDNYERLAGELEGQIAALTAKGSPSERLAVLQRERADLQQKAASANGAASQTESRARQLAQLEESLRTSTLGEVCPTCARPFQPGEASKTLDALAEQIELLKAEVSSERARASQLTVQANQLGSRETAIAKENDELLHLNGRLENGLVMIENQKQEVATIALELGLRLREAQRRDVPTLEEVAALDAELTQAEAECSRKPRLEMGRERLGVSIDRQVAIEQQIAALGIIAYDVDAHRSDHAAWAIARDAVARIEELQKQVARRAERETALAQVTTILTELGSNRTRIDVDIAALGFDTIEVETANRVFAETLDRERAATAAAHVAEQQLTKAQRERDDLEKLESRLKALSDESAAAELAAGELDRVYREFARFEKFVAVAVTPALGEIASELLDKATDGKYDRLEFTEDYGIEVYDGEDDRFPLSQYSGGERDVIALCARLALSQVIGGQAATPISFMVLDEVFGSLDLDRRRNLMEMLQRLVEESQAFQQLFVISHVDDVRAASMFDEVWKVAETSDGVSQLEQVSVTGTLEDY
jgi:exonuclease SbcC